MRYQSPESMEPGPGARGLAIRVSSFLIGLVASALPARWRDRVPTLQTSAWAEAAVPSALIQVLLMLALYAVGYPIWMDGIHAEIERTAHAAGHGGRFDVEGKIAMASAALTGNPFLPLIYFFTSWHGFLTGLLAGTGVIRLLHDAITSEPMPEPLLGIGDWLWVMLAGKRDRKRREDSKDRSPDRVIVGGGGDAFALRIETADDLPWREGNTVLVQRVAYRVKARAERQGPAGLRIVFDLESQPDGEAIRGTPKPYAPARAPIVSGSDPG